ncbi:hypothetical protein BS78_06G028900 [Paspalum vaginatum]|nr:hypothetical protein BS78_06G028900 [Paspalum vaginatum]
MEVVTASTWWALARRAPSRFRRWMCEDPLPSSFPAAIITAAGASVISGIHGATSCGIFHALGFLIKVGGGWSLSIDYGRRWSS